MITNSHSNQSHVDTKIELSCTHACRNAVKFSIIPICIHENVCLYEDVCGAAATTLSHSLRYSIPYCIGLNASQAFVESAKYRRCIQLNILIPITTNSEITTIQ